MTVQNIFDFLNTRFPVSSACDFDNVGLLVGNASAMVDKALVTLDCDLNAVKYAAENGCNLIITHHPVIFDGLKKVLYGSVVYSLIENNISVISMHTNLDVGTGGVNDCLCDALGLHNVTSVTAADGYLLRKGETSSLSADMLAAHIKSRLGGAVKFVGCGHKIKNVLVCSGSGGRYLDEVFPNNCDALITADVKHDQFIEAGNLDIALFDAGHFNTETIVINPLKQMLQEQFAQIEWITADLSEVRIV